MRDHLSSRLIYYELIRLKKNKQNFPYIIPFLVYFGVNIMICAFGVTSLCYVTSVSLM